MHHEKNRGEGFCMNLGWGDVIIDQIIDLHCTEVSSYDCCHQVSDFKAKIHQI